MFPEPSIGLRRFEQELVVSPVKERQQYKIIGDCIMFDMLPGLMLPYLDSSEPETKDPFRLVTKNREIVMQGENACSLSDSEWLIVHRLNNVKSHALTIAELCDPDLGVAVWEAGCVPQWESLGNLASKINGKFLKSDIVATVKYSKTNNEFSLHLPTNTEESTHENDIETKFEPDKQSKTKKAAKRKTDAQRNPPPCR